MPDASHPRPIPAALRSGQAAEARALLALRLEKNTEVWRPTPEQMASPIFRQIVGSPHFTSLGLARGTVLDSVNHDLAEIKSGASVLSSTYQLRLQACRAALEDRRLRLYTNRPIDSDLRRSLDSWDVVIEPLPSPDLDSPGM